MCKQMDYRLWWCWHEGTVMYVIAPDTLGCTPVSTDTKFWQSIGCYETVRDALCYIGDHHKSRLTFHVRIDAVTPMDVMVHERAAAASARGERRLHLARDLAEAIREHEAESIPRMRAIEDGVDNSFPVPDTYDGPCSGCGKHTCPGPGVEGCGADNPYDGGIPI